MNFNEFTASEMTFQVTLFIIRKSLTPIFKILTFMLFLKMIKKGNWRFYSKLTVLPATSTFYCISLLRLTSCLMWTEFFFIQIRGQLVLCTVHVGSEDVGLCSDVIRDHRHKHSAVGKHGCVKHTFTHCSSQCASRPKINCHGFDLM